MKQLAIVIPAYKATFLKETLDSIAKQTCKDFVLYIGDDASPYDLKAIIDDYANSIDIIYKRFDTNLGGSNLVKHWERCIALSTEPYIWLFSDDDIMEAECVENFIKLSKDIRDNYLIHFNINIIDEINNRNIIIPNTFPMLLSAFDFIQHKLSLNKKKYLHSFVVEFIFSRELYKLSGGFVEYDLAWGSDFITWVKMSSISKGIYTIDGNHALIKWRKSLENISPSRNKDLVLRKIFSTINYAAYINDFFIEYGYKKSIRDFKFVLHEILKNIDLISGEELNTMYRLFVYKIGYRKKAFIFFYLIKLFKLCKRKN